MVGELLEHGSNTGPDFSGSSVVAEPLAYPLYATSEFNQDCMRVCGRAQVLYLLSISWTQGNGPLLQCKCSKRSQAAL